MSRLPLVICTSADDVPPGYDLIATSEQVAKRVNCPCCLGRSVLIHTLNGLYLAWVKGERSTSGVALLSDNAPALLAELKADVLTTARWTII